MIVADHGTATAFPATVAGTTTYPAQNYVHVFPMLHVFGNAAAITVGTTMYPAQNYTHNFPAVHVFGGVTAIIFGPW